MPEGSSRRLREHALASWVAAIVLAACDGERQGSPAPANEAGPQAGAAAESDGDGLERTSLERTSEDEPVPDCREPLLFGHRGTPLYRPENTLPAFRYAIDEGGDGVEVDVRLTADRHVVVMHDDTTGRTTDDGADREVAELSFDELEQLDAGAWFDPLYAGTRVPSLAAVVAALPDDTLLLLDLKGDGIGPAIIDEIQDLGIEARALVSSFDEALLAEVHAALPDVPIVYFLDTMDEIRRAPETGATYLRVPDEIQNRPENVDRVLAAGYLPAVGGTYVQWNGSLGLVNNMTRTAQRRRDRRPAGCIP